MGKYEYKTIQASYYSRLEKELNEAVVEGWQLHSFQVSSTPSNTSSSPRDLIIAVMERPTEGDWGVVE